MTVVYFLVALLCLPLIPVYFLALALCCAFVPKGKEFEKDSSFFRFWFDMTTALFLWASRVRIHSSGEEKVPKDQRLLFVSNHRSRYDSIALWRIYKKWNLAYISKPSNFKIPLLGTLIRKCCFMAIDRENARNAIVTINKAARLLKDQEVSIGVFPEGTRSLNGELLPFHNGVFKIAQKANSPMVVFSVTGTEHIAKNWPLHHTDVYIDILEVMPPESLAGVKTELIGEHVRELIQNNIEKRNG